MLNKIKWLIIPIIMLGLTGCPWDKKSSKESKELLEKILNYTPAVQSPLLLVSL